MEKLRRELAVLMRVPPSFIFRPLLVGDRVALKQVSPVPSSSGYAFALPA